MAWTCWVWCTGAYAQDTAQDSVAIEPAWQQVVVPDVWREVPQGVSAPIDGYSWYRCRVQVPSSWRDEQLMLFVEALDDARAAYVNGQLVGTNGSFPPRYRSGLGQVGRFPVPVDLPFAAPLLVSIRVYQSDPRPNFYVAPPVLWNAARSEAIRLQGNWEYQPGNASAETVAARFTGPQDFDLVDHVEDLESYVRRRDGDQPPLPPQAAARQFQVPADIEFQLVLSEPEIAQPLFLAWDARERLWVMEYRQYPDVAGLEVVSRDIFLRTVYDKVPLAPPQHTPGLDRISIHEDVDGDGVYDSHRVFLDGLNLATSFAIGRGGVWVTNPPYLLFYPDRDGDDVPDGDPEVHLEGFGLEDSHSVINSLRFGPDGWLYGAQGSTVTAAVHRPGSEEPPQRTMGQQIWRYHPELRRFEVFAEGGGNTFGIEIDAKGRVFSGHNGGDTRGFHYVQGGYYRKGFGKHGGLSNPFAFGFFEQMAHHDVARFTHNFILYEGNALPEHYRGRLFGIEPLQGQVVMSDVEPDRSSFRTRDISRPVLTEDQWFRPVDIKLGPDDCIYIADMYEQRIDHSSHYAGRVDRTNGRVYRLKPRDLVPKQPVDWSSLSSLELTSRLRHANRWQRQTIVRLLGDRADAALKDPLTEALKSEQGDLALDLLWALHASDEFSSYAEAFLRHPNEFVRAWTVRMVCDKRQISAPFADSLVALAEHDSSLEVRKQLASSARRIPGEFALPVLRQLLARDDDASDIHQPLLLWWAIEAHCADEHGGPVVALLADRQLWQRPLVSQYVVARLMKRLAMGGTRAELLQAATLLTYAPDAESTQLLLQGFEEAYQGRSLAGLPTALATALANAGGPLSLRLRQADPQSISEAVTMVRDSTADPIVRRQLIDVFAEMPREEFLEPLLELLATEKDTLVLQSTLSALQSYRDPRIPASVISIWAQASPETRASGAMLLASRATWSTDLLHAVDSQIIPAETVDVAAVRTLMLHNDDVLNRAATQVWGEVATQTEKSMQDEIEQVRTWIAEANGNPKQGKPLFMERCGKCHRLFDEGGDIGPDLTSFQRDDLDRLLANVVSPSREIREGFENYAAILDDGRVVTGFLVGQDQHVVILRSMDGQNSVLQRDQLEELNTIPRSLMPEQTLRDLSPQQVRDLFAYFRSSQPVNY